jgi:hypothetical protein
MLDLEKVPFANNNSPSTIIELDEQGTEQIMQPMVIEEGIFRTEDMIERDLTNSEIINAIPAPKKIYGSLYCHPLARIHDDIKKLKNSKKHRIVSPHNPNREVHTTEYMLEPKPKKLDKTRYWIKVQKGKYMCRLCKQNGDPDKTWKSLAWVRRHWMSCAHNPNIGADVPRPRSNAEQERFLNAKWKKMKEKKVARILVFYLYLKKRAAERSANGPLARIKNEGLVHNVFPIGEES